MVYVKDKTVWQYKALTQFVEGGGAERGTGSSAGKDELQLAYRPSN